MEKQSLDNHLNNWISLHIVNVSLRPYNKIEKKSPWVWILVWPSLTDLMCLFECSMCRFSFENSKYINFTAWKSLLEKEIVIISTYAINYFISLIQSLSLKCITDEWLQMPLYFQINTEALPWRWRRRRACLPGWSGSSCSGCLCRSPERAAGCTVDLPASCSP